MDYSDPSDTALRLAEFREKVKSLSLEELIALNALMKRSKQEMNEEFELLAEQITQCRVEQLRQKREKQTSENRHQRSGMSMA